MSAAGCGPPPIVRGIVNRRVVGGVVSFKVRYASAAGQRAPDSWVGEELLSAAQVESFLARRRPAAVAPAAAAGAPSLQARVDRALQQLHDKGKGRVPAGGLRVPAKTGRSLAPARRLHKIMKGRRLSARSDAAKSVLAPATQWVAAERAKGRKFNGVTTAKARISLAKELRAALSLPSLEVARGLVTKLKQKKLLL